VLVKNPPSEKISQIFIIAYPNRTNSISLRPEQLITSPKKETIPTAAFRLSVNKNKSTVIPIAIPHNSISPTGQQKLNLRCIIPKFPS
jgi:hypothetical protein